MFRQSGYLVATFGARIYGMDRLCLDPIWVLAPTGVTHLAGEGAIVDTVYTFAMRKGGVSLLHELEWFCMIANLVEWWTLLSLIHI